MKTIIRNPKYEGNCDKKILIIDDNFPVTRIFMSQLPKDLNEVCYSSNLEEAIKELEDPKSSFDMVIADTRLPKTEDLTKAEDYKGLEILQKLKEVYEGHLILISICGSKDSVLEKEAKDSKIAYFPREISKEIDNVSRYISNLFKLNPPRLSI